MVKFTRKFEADDGWKPLPLKKKHRAGLAPYGKDPTDDTMIMFSGFETEDIDKLASQGSPYSFFSFCKELEELAKLYRQQGDERMFGSLSYACHNMLAVSGHGYEHGRNTDQKGKYIGFGAEDLHRPMEKDDIKLVRDIAGVSDTTLVLMKEFIETGCFERTDKIKRILERTQKVELEKEDPTKNYIPKFTEALKKYYATKNKLKGSGKESAKIAFMNSAEALKDQFVGSVDDIEIKKLHELPGVGPASLKLLKRFVETGRIATDDHTPEFLEALWELVAHYEETDDFRAKSFKKAAEALKGQIVTSVDDIEMMKLHELPGVGKSTLELLKEFISLGRIKRLDEVKCKKFWDAAGDNLMKAIKDLPEGFELSIDGDGRLLLNGSSPFEPETPETGLPFTFEYKRRSYEIDGSYDIENTYGGYVNFEGTVKSSDGTEKKLSFRYDHGFGNMKDFVEFECPYLDKRGAFTDDNKYEDEEWFTTVQDECYSAFIWGANLPSYH